MVKAEGQGLENQYAGDDLQKIQDTGKAVMDDWKDLLNLIKKRAALLSDALDKFRFLNMVRDLMAWMEGTIKQMDLQEKPKYVVKTPFWDIVLLLLLNIIFVWT